jgi:hypothetical protein
MSINLPGLKTLDIINMFLGYPSHYMGSNQSPMAWYERLQDFLIENASRLRINRELFICQVYVDDIIFGSTNENYCKEFGELISKEYESSMIEDLTFFSWFSSQANERRNFHLSREIYQRSSQEVQHG